MKWLKYRHKFGYGHSEWRWFIVDDNVSDEDIEEQVDQLGREYDYSEHYRGIDHEVVPHAPRWVVENKLRSLEGKLRAAAAEIKTYVEALPDAYDCPQCGKATPARGSNASHNEIKPCPSCGREVIETTLAFWLMPDDKDAVVLLGSLVEKGARSVRSEKFRWPLEDHEDAAYNRLVMLGLAGGSSQNDDREIHATKKGESEWQKHKAHGGVA